MTRDELIARLTFPAKDIGYGYMFKDIAPHIHCADGAHLSVQASKTHYCSPRNDLGPWSTVEVGYPNPAPPESWSEFFDGDWENEERTQSVYGYVPVDMVVDYINAHGGVKEA